MSTRSAIWRDQGVLALVIVALGLIAGLILDSAKAQFGSGTLAIGLILVIIIFAGLVFCAFKLLIPVIEDHLEKSHAESILISQELQSKVSTQVSALQLETKNSLSGVAHALQALKGLLKQDWLVSRAELMDIERAVDAEEIWIISQLLQEETSQDTFLPIVRENLKRGIKYLHVLPDGDSAHARAEQIKSVHNNSNQISFLFVSDQLFDLVCAQDIVIYAPVGRNANAMTAFMNLPTLGGSEFFICLEAGYARDLVGRILARLRKSATAVQ